MNAISSYVSEKVQDEKSFFDNLARVMKQIITQEIISENSNLSHTKDKIRLFVDSILLKNKNQLLFDHAELKNKTSFVTNREENYLRLAQMKNNMLDPYNILMRGFSYTLYNDQLVFDPKEVPLGAEVETVVFKGRFKSKKTK